jgi:hypothetical protein
MDREKIIQITAPTAAIIYGLTNYGNVWVQNRTESKPKWVSIDKPEPLSREEKKISKETKK